MADESAKAGGILGRLPPWPRNALNNSVIAMEQAYRQRKALPLLTDSDIEALKAGQPMSWESGDGVPHRLLPVLLPRPQRLRHLRRQLRQRRQRTRASARMSPNGLRKEGSGASRRSPRNKRDADVRAYQHSMTSKLQHCWESQSKQAQRHPLRRLLQPRRKPSSRRDRSARMSRSG